MRRAFLFDRASIGKAKACLMDRAGLDQLKERNFRIELGSIAPLHLEDPSHGAEGRGQRTSRRVLEARIGLERRLFSDDAGAMDFLGVAGAVDDRPMSIEELNGRFADVRDSDRVEKEPSTGRWTAVFRRKSSANVDANARGQGIGRGFEEVVICHGPDSSRNASGSRRNGPDSAASEACAVCSRTDGST